MDPIKVQASWYCPPAVLIPDGVMEIIGTINVFMFSCIICTVVRTVGMGRMPHICNTKCSRL